MREKRLLKRNALVVVLDHLRVCAHATPRELWLRLYRADLHIGYSTFREWLCEWAKHSERTHITRTALAQNRCHYSLNPSEQLPYTRLVELADRYFANG